MTDLRAAFLQNLAEPVATLEDALAAGAADTGRARDSILAVAHQLKGSGASFGFPEVTEAAAAVLAARDRDFQTRARLLLGMLLDLDDEDRKPAGLLIVEDDPALTLLLRTALEQGFDRIEAAGSLAEARTALSGFVPTLILLDLSLPDGDGRAFLREIRQRGEARHAHVAVMSAHEERAVAKECQALGADGFLQKPLDPLAIATQVEEILAAPRTASAIRSGSRAAVSPGRWEKTRVLVAEDDPLTAGLIVDRLERRGFEVLLCRDGQEALEAARRRKLGLAVVDISMPRMNGFELIARLRGMKRHAETPVLVLTSLSEESSVVRAFDLGADDYMLKPFSPTELTARALRLIGE
jgi:DNA-binding response OmpR family regulator/HPt (histidine-containing phosphotransfer) domain-containing protein